jgi:hypothetical protein
MFVVGTFKVQPDFSIVDIPIIFETEVFPVPSKYFAGLSDLDEAFKVSDLDGAFKVSNVDRAFEVAFSPEDRDAGTSLLGYYPVIKNPTNCFSHFHKLKTAKDYGSFL